MCACKQGMRADGVDQPLLSLSHEAVNSATAFPESSDARHDPREGHEKPRGQLGSVREVLAVVGVAIEDASQAQGDALRPVDEEVDSNAEQPCSDEGGLYEL